MMYEESGSLPVGCNSVPVFQRINCTSNMANRVPVYCLSSKSNSWAPWTVAHGVKADQKCLWTMYGLINIKDGKKTIPWWWKT
jgi:hypothetical protein